MDPKVQNLNTQLGIAAENNDISEVIHLLECGAEINALDSRRLSPDELKELRLSADKETLRSSRGGLSPLMRSSGAGHLEMVRVLLERGAEVDARDNTGMPPWGRTALMFAARNGHAPVVNELLSRGANPVIKDKGFQDEDGEKTALHYAAENGHATVVRLLAGIPRLINLRTKSGDTPLMLATIARSWESVDALLLAKADPNISEKDLGTTPLHTACYEDDVRIALSLIKAGADVNAVDKQSVCPLIEATRKDSLEIVEALLKAGAKIPPNALKVATKRNAVRVARLLREKNR
jgi:ankyrin repeat protein